MADRIDIWRGLFEVDSLHVIRSLTGGLTDSSVELVQFQTAGETPQVAVLKVGKNESEWEAEYEGHHVAMNSWLSEVAAGLPKKAEYDGQYALLLPIAFAGEVGNANQTLHDLITNGYVDDAVTVSAAIGRLYGKRLVHCLTTGASNKERAPFAWIQEIITPWAPRILRTDKFAWKQWGFPAPEEPVYVDRDRIRTNPLWCVGQSEAWKDDVPSFVADMQHCDLNTRNVILPELIGTDPAAEEIIKLIDFEKVEETTFFHDPCFLAMWCLIAADEGGQIPLEASDWNRLPEHFLARVFDKNPEGQQPTQFRSTLDGISRMFSELLAHVPQHNLNMIKADLAVSLGCISLATSYYELRNLVRAERKNGKPVDAIRLRRAVCFFRISTLAFEECSLRSDRPLHPLDIQQKDVRGIHSDSDRSRINEALGDSVSADGIVQIAESPDVTWNHQLTNLARTRISHLLSQDVSLLAGVVDRLESYCKQPFLNARVVGRIASLVESVADDGQAIGDLSPKKQLILYMCLAHRHNHRGFAPGDAPYWNTFMELRAAVADEDRRLRCDADAVVGVAYANQLNFEQAKAELLKHPLNDATAGLIGPERVGIHFSSLGQWDAFQGRFETADDHFSAALAAFSKSIEPHVRQDQTLRTKTYQVLNRVDWQSTDTAASLKELLHELSEMSIEQAGSYFASTHENCYVHHLYLRFALTTNVGEDYLADRLAWQSQRYHPWELIELNRILLMNKHGLLGSNADRELARACAKSAITTCFGDSSGPMLATIGMVITAVAASLEIADDEDVYYALGRSIHESQRNRLHFDFDTLREALQTPRPDRLQELLGLLTFQHR